MARKDLITPRHIQAYAQQLAELSGITPQQALRVLEVLHIKKLNENLLAVREILMNEKSVNALGMSRAEAKAKLQELSPQNLKIRDMRIGFKPSGAHVLMPPV